VKLLGKKVIFEVGQSRTGQAILAQTLRFATYYDTVPCRSSLLAVAMATMARNGKRSFMAN